MNNIFFKSKTIDLHIGGCDLKFPHHENERIQYIAHNKRELSRIWVYNGHLNFKNLKMSKSIGNIIKIRDFINDHEANTLKWIFYNSKYSTPLNITDLLIQQTKSEIKKYQIDIIL